MRTSVLIVSLTFASAANTSLDPLTVSENDDVNEESLLFRPRQYIVEFTDSIVSRTKRDILSAHYGVTVLKTFESDVFSGAKLETDAENIDTLLALPESDADAYAVHWATGVGSLHGQGMFGEGAKVGVIDTGVWYTHEALGGGFGKGFKVAGGYDFVGDDWEAGSTRNPDEDPLDQSGHGTHVAGIVAGDSESGWVGVAPKSTIYSYKVFGAGDGTYEDIIIEAMLKAFEDGVDVITISIGGRGGWANSVWAVVASRIADAGVVMSIGAGNYGTGGPYYASSGSSGVNVLSVASAEVRKAEDEEIKQPSYFSSWGGLYDLQVKPDITAPGTDIFSSWPGESNSEFVLLSGTSMATPYVAGVAALFIGKHGGRKVHGKDFAKELSMRIVATGSALPWLWYNQTAADDFIAPVHQVGGGLVNAAKVVKYTTGLNFEKFGLNDTLHFKSNQGVTIENKGTETLVYSFEVEDWSGFQMLKDFDPLQSGETPRIRYRPETKPLSIGVQVKLPGEITLSPGQKKKAKFAFQLPTDLNDTTIPVYNGCVIIKASNGEVVAVPYQGLAFNLKYQMRNPFAGTYPWLRSTNSYLSKTNWTLDLSTGVQDFPKLFLKVKWGVREIRWDIYERGFEERDWQYPPVVGKRGYLGAVAPWANSDGRSTYNPNLGTSNETFTMPVFDVTRNALVTGGYTTSYWWFGKLANGSYINPGNYTSVALDFFKFIPY
ncbi:subtilase [Dactylonectria estremocensis]|uniref:Subtilase n=1 Tax=Dactylonectria estremocensis TaxID=1079267 RepID=A0A9P9F2A4_9HYPO|nr:subtilase [Dactylonectria estremocensis]